VVGIFTFILQPRVLVEIQRNTK